MKELILNCFIGFYNCYNEVNLNVLKLGCLNWFMWDKKMAYKSLKIETVVFIHYKLTEVKKASYLQWKLMG